MNGESVVAQDISATITVWRKRTLNVYAMAKQGPGNYYPSDDGSFNSLKAAFRIAYANQAPTYTIANPNPPLNPPADAADRWAYLDFDFVEKTLNLDYQSPIKVEPALDWSVYLMQKLHTLGAQHSDNKYDVIGVDKLQLFQAGEYSDIYGWTGHEPHSGIAVGYIQERGGPTPTVPSINRCAVHEVGHALIDESLTFPIHDHHNDPNTTCPYLLTKGTANLSICPKHIKMLRDAVSRSFEAHNDQVANYATTVNDSQRFLS